MHWDPTCIGQGRGSGCGLLLEARLAEYIDTYNENPQPFVWTKSAKQILDKVGRARQALGHQST